MTGKNRSSNSQTGFEKTWRWFGPNDPISLKEIKQAGVTGIVNALHQIPVGEIWTVEEIKKRKELIESEGFGWSVVESLPVHENIKKGKDNYKLLIENYKQSIRNLGSCGIDTICYNFMPVLDWSRTDLKVFFKDGSITTKFESKVFAAFDLFILKRPGAEEEYTEEQILDAEKYFKSMNEEQKENLLKTILYGLPGSLEAYSIDEFRTALKEYEKIGDAELRGNLYSFIKEIIPVAEESGIRMGIHPDDPPWSLLGLPRIVGNKNDIKQILNVSDSMSNGITFCTGSFGAGYENNLVDMAETFSHRVNFVHLRNLTRNENGDFMESFHLEGDVDMYGVIKAFLIEQKKRKEEGRKDFRMPMRPDHGNLMVPDMHRKNVYPGYSLFGRMRGLAELRGMEQGIIRSLDL
ncbi:MAG: mannonate dehydratase [Ignavibacteria bacterium]|jgi:mannonate dehydratase